MAEAAVTANMKLAEAERLLGVSRWTLYRYIRQGRLPVVKLAGGHYRVSAEAVAALEAAPASDVQSQGVHPLVPPPNRRPARRQMPHARGGNTTDET